MDATLPEPIPAATLILMRERAQSPPELLLTERAQGMAFAAGALVFPGGRIDPQDHELAARIGSGVDHAAARVAAIRETIEETGVAPALTPAADAAAAAALRAALAGRAPFADALARLGLALDLAALTPFARWCPTFREARRFDTLFFVAAAPPGAAAGSADQVEAVRAWWATAADALAEADAGRARVIFPTRRNLERLARFASLDAARADALARPPAKIVPWIEERGGAQWLCIPDDLGYPVTAELLETARRS